MPKAPTGLVVTRIGTHQISLSWDPIKERDLLGNLSLLVYYVQPLGSQSASSPIANYSLNGLNPATLYTIMVCIYIGHCSKVIIILNLIGYLDGMQNITGINQQSTYIHEAVLL